MWLCRESVVQSLHLIDIHKCVLPFFPTCSQVFATALIVTAVVIEPQNKQYSSWVKRVGKQGRGPLLQSGYNWYTNRWQNSNLTTIFLTFFFCFYSSPLNLHKLTLNLAICAPIHQLSPAAHTSPLTWSNAFFGSHGAHSSGVSVYHSFSCHIWEHLTAPEQCPVLHQTTSHHQIDLGNWRQASMMYQTRKSTFQVA